jgi:hypothetical protein
MKKNLYIIPFLMFLATIISCYYPIDFVLWGNILGNSILANIWLYHIVFNTGNYCRISKLMPFLLSFINVVDIIGIYINFDVYGILLKTLTSVIAITLILYGANFKKTTQNK